MKSSFSAAAAAAAAVLMTAVGTGSLAAQETNFAGRTINILIPSAPGDGTDAWVRFLAPHMHKHLPGQPEIVVRNMPGGSQTVGANYFAKNARPDGTDVLTTTASTQFPFLLDDPRVRYDYAKWTAVLASPVGGVVYAGPGFRVTSARNADKLKGMEFRHVSQGPTSIDVLPELGFKLLGVEVKPVFGAGSRDEGRLAFMRGETPLDYQTSFAFIRNVRPLVEQGKAKPLWTWGALDKDGNIVRDPTFPDLPHFGEVYEYAHGKKPSGTGWRAYMAFFTAGYGAQKFLLVPNGTPKPILDAWASALRKMVDDPDFKAEARDRLGEYPQYVGAAAEKMKTIATRVPKEAKDYVKTWLRSRGGAGAGGTGR